MNHLKSVAARIAFAVLILMAVFAAGASAQPVSKFQILLNLDNNPSTGCNVPTLTGTFQGVERILTTTVDTSAAPPQVTAISVSSDCGVTSTPVPLPPGGDPLGMGNGTGGASVIETFIPAGQAPLGNPPIIRLGVLSFDNGNVLRDEMLTATQGPGNGPPILMQAALSIAEVPTLSEMGLLLLGLLLALAAVALLRRRSATAVMIALLLLGLAGAAWAAAFDLNGNTTAEWTPDTLLATEPTPDAPAGTDIRALFGKRTPAGLYFRIDADLAYNQTPAVNPATFSIPENSANGTNVGTVTFTDPDPGQNHTFAITAGNTGGAFAIDPSTGQITVANSAALDFETTPTFALTVQVTDDGAPPATGTGTVTVNLTNVDDVNPTAVDDAATVAEDSPATAVDVLANDTDADGGAISITSVTQPANGAVVITGGGTGLTYQPNANYCNNPSGSPDTFTYTLAPGGSTATVSMTVTCVDDPPTAVDDAATVSEDSGANAIPVLANDTDIDGGPISITSVTQPANGAVAITGGGSGLTYTPNADYCNQPPGTTLDTFTYTLTPGSTTATVTVTVTCVDDPPVAVADTATVTEDDPATAIPVLANDTDVDGGSISIASVTQPANGTVVITGGGTGLTYQPNADYCNSVSGPADTFTYTLTPGSSSTTVSVTVTCVDDNPVAVADSATVIEDSGANAINVLANDTDVDGGPKSVASVTQPANGVVAITGGGTGVSYTPNANYCNSVSGPADTFTYTLTPGSSSTTVSVTVTCVDDPPVAVNDAATVSEDSGANTIDVLANDTDIDGGPKLVTSVTQPANGTVVITGGGTGLTYAPSLNYCNTPPGTTPDTFTYTLAPGGSSATVTVAVTCVDDSPVIDLDADDNKGTTGSDFAVTFTEGDPATLLEDPADATVSDVDSANLASLTVTITNILDPGFETLSTDVTGTSITANYVPATGVLTLTGPDTVANFQTVLRKIRYQDTDNDPDPTPRVIHFVANDGSTNSNTATSTVTIVSVDTPPTAVADAATVSEDSGANAIDVLANDTDPDNGPKSVASVTQPANGTVAITGGGTGVSYTPNADYCNSVSGPADTFTYTLTPGSSSATVTVTVTCVDDSPVAVADSATVTEDSGATAINVLANDTDPDGGPKSIASVTQPANGVVVITGGGTGLTYQPNANYCNSVSGPADTFTYTLTPGSSSTTVTVTVTCVDDDPTAVADSATVVEDSGANAINVLANDTDPDGGPKSVASVTQPANGVVAITGGGTGVSYTPNANYCNSVSGPADTFTYTLTPGGSSTTVSVTVTCVDDDPVAVADAATVNEDSGANAINVLANDTDIDGGPKSIASVTQPANGTVVITGGGTGLTYAPNANYCNNPPGTTLDTFNYTLSPGGSSATVTVTVTCVDDPPVAVADAATVTEDSGANAIDVLANDTDVDAGPKSVGSVTQPANGTVAITGGGTGVSYTPNANYCNNPPGTTLDTFTYTLTPGSSSTTVTVTVTCVDDNPVAVADSATVVEDSGTNAINVLANDTDVDGGPKNITSVTQPANGVVAITGGGTGVSYTPNANYCNNPPGTFDTFTYTLTPGGSSTTVSVSVTCVDDPPTDIALSNSSVNENQPVNTVVGTFSTTDPDVGDSHTYTLVGGVGATDNGSFNISGNQLRTSAMFNFEVKNSYSIRVRTTDSGGLFFEKIFTITVNDLPEPPVANNDSYDTIGNTELRVDLAAGTTPNVSVTSPGTPPNLGVLDNDIDEDMGQTNTLKVSGIVGCADTSAPFGDGPACNTANGGTVLVRDDGSFSYFPKAGDTAASDSFQYTVRDTTSLTANGTVTINRKERVWYVKNDAPAGGQGRSNDPFNTLAAAQTASLANDYIFVYFGDGTNTGQNAGIVLKSGQHLLGEHVGLTVTIPSGTFNGTAAPVNVSLVMAVPGNRPFIDGPATPAAGTGHGVEAVDVIPAEVRGINVGAEPATSGGRNAIEWRTTAAFAGSGAFTISDNMVRRGLNGVHISLVGSGTTSLSLHDNSIMTSNGNGIDVQETGTGALTITGFANNTVGASNLGTGITITNAKFDAVPGGGYDTVSGGTTVLGVTGDGMGGNGVVLSNVSGDLAFTDLDIFADGGAAFRLTGTGTVNTGAGTGTRVTVGAGVGIFEAVTGPAVDVSNATIDLQLVSLKSAGSSTTGVSLDSTTGTFSAGSGSTITSATGTDFNVNAGNAAVTYNGTISDTTGRLVSVTNTTGGTKSFTGTISDSNIGTGQGIFLNSNTSATISFTGALTLSTGANDAFTATGGGTVTAVPSSGFNTLTTTTGTALKVQNTTIGASGLTFRSISAGTAASGPASGIILNNTGASGGLTVSGTGSAGSGGTIQKTTGDGVSLTSTANVNLSWMKIQNGSQNGILGSSVTGLNLSNSSVTGNGTTTSHEGLNLSNLLGTSTWTNLTVTGNAHNNAFIDNTSGTLSSLTITGSSFSNNSAANGNHGFLFQARGTSTVSSVNISGSTFSGNKSIGLQTIASDTATVSDFTISSSTFTNQQIAIDCSKSQTSNMTCKILNNATITGQNSHAINLATAAGAGTGGTFKARVTGNTIGNSGVAGSGSAIGNCLRVNMNGDSANTVLIDSNTLRQCPNGRGIEVIGRNGTGGTDVTVTNNDVNPQDTSGFPLAAILVQSNCVTVCNSVRSDVRGNTVPSGTATDLLTSFLELVETGASTLQLVDSPPANADCTSQLTSTNTGSASANAGCSLIAGPINTPP